MTTTVLPSLTSHITFLYYYKYYKNTLKEIKHNTLKAI